MSSSIKNDGEMKKFLFDNNDFDESKIAEADRPAFSENQMILAKNQGIEQGRKEGLADAAKNQEEQIIALLGKFSVHAEKMIVNEEKREISRMVDAAKIALRAIQKLTPELAQRYSMEEIENVITGAIETRKDEPRIAVTVATTHLEKLKSRIDDLAREKGYPGKIIVIADDNMAATDCRVEWADGGAERIFERLLAQLEEEFSKAIGGMEKTIDEIKDQEPITNDTQPELEK